MPEVAMTAAEHASGMRRVVRIGGTLSSEIEAVAISAESMARWVGWGQVTAAQVLRAMQKYGKLGAERFFAQHGFAPATTYELVHDGRSYPPKAILGTAYELAAGERLASPDFKRRRVRSRYRGSSIPRPALVTLDIRLLLVEPVILNDDQAEVAMDRDL